MKDKYDEDFITITSNKLTQIEKAELYAFIHPIIESDYWQENIKTIPHHDEETIALHSLKVCVITYQSAKKYRSNHLKSLCIGAVAHDMFGYNWQETNHKKKFKELHGFTHPKIAYDNFSRLFPDLNNNLTKDIILKHMWPLTIIPPRYFESWLVCFFDKIVSLFILKKKSNWYKFLGISYHK